MATHHPPHHALRPDAASPLHPIPSSPPKVDVTPHTYIIKEISYVEWAASFEQFKRTLAIRTEAH